MQKGKRLTKKEAEAARIARNAYYREYRKQHPEKVKAIQARHWLKIAQKNAEEDKQKDV